MLACLGHHVKGQHSKLAIHLCFDAEGLHFTWPSVLHPDKGQVAIFDATNSTATRRNLLVRN